MLSFKFNFLIPLYFYTLYIVAYKDFMFLFFIDAVAPIVTGPTLLNVTYNTTTNFNIEANVTGNVTYFISTNHTSFTMVNNKTGEVNFNPILLNETINFVAVSDENGLSGLFQPKVLYCYCLNGGTCDYDVLQLGKQTKKTTV